MSRSPTIAPALPRDAATAAHGAGTLHRRVHACVRDFGPLVAALALGLLLGVAARGSFPVGIAGVELASVVLLAGLASAAILPRDRAPSAQRASTPERTGPDLPQISSALAAQRVFVLLAAALMATLAFARGLDGTIAWAPLVLVLQTALAVGLAFFATALARTRLGHFLPARVLVSAWVLASPGAWLVHAPLADSAPAWNPLHHLVAAWRAILLPGVGTSESIGDAVLALAPCALLCVVLGFAALVASEPGPGPDRSEPRA